MRKNIAQNMVDILYKHNRKNVWYGDIEIIEECAKLSSIRKSHPKATIQCILNALDRSELFTKGYIISDINGKVQKYRCFSIKSNHLSQALKKVQ